MPKILTLIIGFILILHFRDGKTAEIEYDKIDMIWSKSVFRFMGYEITKQDQHFFIDADNILYVDIKEK